MKTLIEYAISLKYEIMELQNLENDKYVDIYRISFQEIQKEKKDEFKLYRTVKRY